MSIAADPDSPRRARWQRSLGARYDAIHALLVRAAHPLAFATFFLTALAVGGGLGALLVSSAGGGDELGIAMAVIVSVVLLIAAAFTFVFTRARGVLGVLFVDGWSTALAVVDDVDRGLLWGIWTIAAASVVLQLALLAWVVPRRVRHGLTHLLLPATLGTIVGAIPVALALAALADGRDQLVLRLTLGALAASGAVLFAMTLVHGLVRRRERAVLASFASARELQPTDPNLEPAQALPMCARLLPNWSWQAGSWRGRLGERSVELVGGFTSSRSPDVPSIHVTLAAIQLRRGGRDLWVRRRDHAYDDVLVGGAASSSTVVGFESIALDELVEFRFGPGTSDLDAYLTIGPEVLALLEHGLRGAQVCRMGDVLLTWIVGGVLDADELDAVLATCLQLAALLEQVDSKLDPSPATSASTR